MSQIHNLIAELETKIKAIEQSIAQAVSQVNQWNQNHHGLLGMLQATKEALVAAHKVADEVAPGSVVDESLNVAENVVNVIDNAVESPAS